MLPKKDLQDIADKLLTLAYDVYQIQTIEELKHAICWTDSLCSELEDVLSMLDNVVPLRPTQPEQRA